MKQLKWEEVPTQNRNKIIESTRLKVPGGWLVHCHINYGNKKYDSINFCPDGKHTWKIND